MNHPNQRQQFVVKLAAEHSFSSKHVEKIQSLIAESCDLKTLVESGVPIYVRGVHSENGYDVLIIDHPYAH